MNILITGISGFVGEYMAKLIANKNPNSKIFGIERNVRRFSIFPELNKKVKIIECDITNYESVYNAIKKIKSDQIYHLAGFASAGGQNKDLIYKINVDGTRNLLKSIQIVNNKAKIVLVSTSYVYGNTNKPVLESARVNPNGAYAESKLKMEHMARKEFKNMNIVIVRPVNHSGPGQKLGFVIPDFISQVVNIKSKIINVGNLKAEREFLDVRDVVSAYYIVMAKGLSHEIYNISRGKTISIENLLKKIIKMSGKNLTIKMDIAKAKPIDIKSNSLNSKKIRCLGWKPKYSIDETLKNVFLFYEKNKVKS